MYNRKKYTKYDPLLVFSFIPFYGKIHIIRRIAGDTLKKLKILWITLIAFLAPLSVHALTYPSTYSKNILIYDATADDVLYDERAEEETEIASLTKIMTTILAIEKIDNLEEKVTITEEMLKDIPWDASVAGLKVGETLSYQDLLYASMLPSGADATHTLAFSLSGSVDAFVREMNDKAKELGMEHTNYVNVTGYDIDNHYSSAEDVLTLLKYALKNDTFKKVYETKSYKMPNGKEFKSTIAKYNESMGLDISNIKGSKTGYTDNAGLCIAATFEANGHEMILITLGAEYVYNDYYNLRDAITLSNFIIEHYDYQRISYKAKKVITLDVELSKEEFVNIYSDKDMQLYLPNDFNKDDISIEFDGVEKLSYKNKKDDVIGKLIYKYQGKVLAEEEVKLEKELPFSLLKFLKKNIIYIILVIVLLYIITTKSKTKKVKRRRLKLRKFFK